MTEVSDQILDAEADLAEERRKRGAAVLDGSAPDHAAVAAAEARLEAIRESERVAEMRRRQQQDEFDADQRERSRAQHGVAAAEYLSAVGKADRAAHEMAQALRDAFNAADRMRSADYTAGKKPNIEMDAITLAQRFVWRLSDLLKGITHPSKFGALRLAMSPFKVDEDWTETEHLKIKSGEEYEQERSVKLSGRSAEPAPQRFKAGRERFEGRF